jgi:hypothetical protein
MVYTGRTTAGFSVTTMLTDVMNVIGWEAWNQQTFITYEKTVRRFLDEVEALKEKA